MSYAARLAARHVPDAAQVQIVLGTLLGAGRLVAAVDGVRLIVVLHNRHRWLLHWTYERIAPLASTPNRARARVVLRSEAHPLFAELAPLLDRPRPLLRVVGREALWVWAMYARVRSCERAESRLCACAPATPLPDSAWRRAS